MIRSFEDLWKAHTELCQGVLIKDIKKLKTADIIIGNTPDAWYNFALPKVSKPADLDLNEIKKALSPINPATTIYLWEKHRKAGFSNPLKRNGYESMGTDTWMILKNKVRKDLETDVPVEHVGLSKFSDYEKITNKVFKEEDNYDDQPYNEVCRQALAGEKKSKTPSFSAEFFMVYKDSRPVAGAGLFLTKEVGYFHNTATLKSHRKKGYHTSLIKARIKFCLERKIPLLYSIVEYKSKSFRNLERFGFRSWQVCELFTLK